MARGIGLQPKASCLERALLANAAHHILQSAAIGMVIKAVADGDEWRAGRRGERRERQIAPCIEPVDAGRGAEENGAGKAFTERAQALG
jgi:hypothetical protein